MDHRVRDLDQIEEQDGDERSRRLGTILMASAAIVGLSLALGVVVGRAAEPAAKVDDPLAKLEGNTASTSTTTQATRKQEPQAPKLEPADLSFPSALTEEEERPEVLAALNAAKAEAAALAEPEADGHAQPAVPAVQAAPPRAPVTAPSAQARDDDDDDTAPTAPPTASTSASTNATKVSTEEMVANIPAAVAVGGGARNLRKAAQHDPLVAAAVHSADIKTSVPQGHDGEYTLQVISYDRPEPSRAFAEGLRAKGHAAFVVTADVPERGRYFRVRLGPFKSRELAEAYRHKFEEQEHMNTFVVHDKDKQPTPPAP